MLRTTLGKVLNGGPLSPKHVGILSRASSQGPKKPEQIEVFIDDVPVKVDPGTTILQVLTLDLFISTRNETTMDYELVGSSPSWRRNPSLLLS